MERGGGGRLLTFSAFRMGANSRLGGYSNKYGIPSRYDISTMHNNSSNIRYIDHTYSCRRPKCNKRS